MACCVALTLLFAWSYRALRWLGLGSSDEAFPPAATWPPVESSTPVPTVGPTDVRTRLGVASMVVGLAWFAAGLVAMHVFGAVPAVHSTAADVAFHGSGLWLATLGLALRHLPRTRPPTVEAA